MFDPLVILWTYYFLKKNSKADELWENYIKYRHTVPCEELFHFSHSNNDLDLYLKLANLITQSFIIRKAKHKIYSHLIKNCMKMSKYTIYYHLLKISVSNFYFLLSLLAHPQRYEFALKCLQFGLVDFSMEEFDLNLLVSLQAGLEKSGISWPWSVRPVEV